MIETPTTGKTVIPPSFRDYTVRSGDTLEKIAKRAAEVLIKEQLE